MGKVEDMLKKKRSSKSKSKTTKDSSSKKKLVKRSKSEDTGSSLATGLISKGYDSVKENQKRIDIAREQAGLRVYRTWLPDGETKIFRFLNEEPITLREHRVQSANSKIPQFFTCLGEDCPLCAIADGRRIGKSRFVGVYVVLERNEYTIKSGDRKGEKVSNSPRLYVEGQQTLSSLALFSAKKGLTNRDYEITRNDKSRTIVPGDKEKLSKKDEKIIKELLTKHEVGSIDELIANQLEMQTLSVEQLEDLFGTTEEEGKSLSKLRNF